MNCLNCKKEIDTKVSTLPATWFGAYEQDRMKAAICLDCIKVKGPNWADKVWAK